MPRVPRPKRGGRSERHRSAAVSRINNKGYGESVATPAGRKAQAVGFSLEKPVRPGLFIFFKKFAGFVATIVAWGDSVFWKTSDLPTHKLFFCINVLPMLKRYKCSPDYVYNHTPPGTSAGMEPAIRERHLGDFYILIITVVRCPVTDDRKREVFYGQANGGYCNGQ